MIEAAAFQLDAKREQPYSPRHDQRRDHFDCPPPPYSRGMGGRLRLRHRPLRRIIPRHLPSER